MLGNRKACRDRQRDYHSKLAHSLERSHIFRLCRRVLGQGSVEIYKPAKPKTRFNICAPYRQSSIICGRPGANAQVGMPEGPYKGWPQRCRSGNGKVRQSALPKRGPGREADGRGREALEDRSRTAALLAHPRPARGGWLVRGPNPLHARLRNGGPGREGANQLTILQNAEAQLDRRRPHVRIAARREIIRFPPPPAKLSPGACRPGLFSSIAGGGLGVGGDGTRRLKSRPVPAIHDRRGTGDPPVLLGGFRVRPLHLRQQR